MTEFTCLSYDERIQIQYCIENKLTLREIASILNRTQTTIYNEVVRSYNAETAQERHVKLKKESGSKNGSIRHNKKKSEQNSVNTFDKLLNEIKKLLIESTPNKSLTKTN